MQRLFLTVVAWLALATPAAAEDAREAFYRGANLAQAGRAEEAAVVLEQIVARGPDEPFADDALLELARIYEERLGDPARAAAAYRRLVAEFPQSRLAIRAQRRAEALAEGLGPDGAGAVPLAAFQAVLADAGTRSREDSIAEVEAILAAHPTWTEAPRARLWLGGLHEQRGALDQAMRQYERVTVTGGPWALRGWKARGDLLVMSGRLDDAEAAYRQVAALARTPSDEAVVQAAGERLAMARQHRRWEWAAWGVLALFLLGTVTSARLVAGSAGRTLRGLARPPTEVLYVVPVAALLTAASLSEHVLLGHAVTFLAIGGVVVAWLNGAALALGPVSRTRALVHVVLCVAAVLAIAVIAALREQLLDVLSETLAHGPDR
jgi:tetratricopeptide (TPR) repeat protein